MQAVNIELFPTVLVNTFTMVVGTEAIDQQNQRRSEVWLEHWQRALGPEDTSTNTGIEAALKRAIFSCNMPLSRNWMSWLWHAKAAWLLLLMCADLTSETFAHRHDCQRLGVSPSDFATESPPRFRSLWVVWDSARRVLTGQVGLIASLWCTSVTPQWQRPWVQRMARDPSPCFEAVRSCVAHLTEAGFEVHSWTVLRDSTTVALADTTPFTVPEQDDEDRGSTLPSYPVATPQIAPSLDLTHLPMCPQTRFFSPSACSVAGSLGEVGFHLSKQQHRCDTLVLERVHV